MNTKTVLDEIPVNHDFLTQWEPYDVLSKKVERAIFRRLARGIYDFQPSHDPKNKQAFKPITFNQIDNILGLAYTSTSSFAALWVCNSGYLWADKDHHFIGFAINTDGEVIGIADDKDENSIYIKF
jgi:hypothetical protein